MKDTRILVEGALSTAIFIVLFLICVYIPPIAIVGMFFWSLPLMFYTARRGFKPGLLAFFASIVLAVLFTHPVTAVSALIFLAVGLVMGYMVFIRKPAFAILGAGSLVAIICIVAYYGVLVTLLNFNPMDELIKSANHFSKIAEKMGPTTTATKEQWDNYREMLKMMPTLLPTILTMGGVIFTLISQLVCAPILRRLGIDFPKWPPFREWVLPRSIIWYYLLALILLYFGKLDTSGTLFMVTLNVFEILEFLMVLQGISFIFYFFHFKGTKLSIPVIVSIIGVIIPFTLYIIRILGIIDLGFGLRGRMKKQ